MDMLFELSCENIYLPDLEPVQSRDLFDEIINDDYSSTYMNNLFNSSSQAEEIEENKVECQAEVALPVELEPTEAVESNILWNQE